MEIRPIRFEAPGGAVAEELVSEVGGRFDCLLEPAVDRSTVYCDTFDWRLWRGDGTLGFTPRPGGVLAEWRRHDGRLRRRRQLDSMPAFVGDLPEGPLRDALSVLVEVRRLLPIVEVDAASRTVRILDDDDKTVARVVVDQASAALPGGSHRHALAPGVIAKPVRGYRREFGRLVDLLEGSLGLERSAGGELSAALDSLGVAPATYSSKLEFDLDPELPAGEAMRIVLTHLLSIIEANEAGVVADLDSEFLHDFRVAVRRTRSAISQVEGVFPEAELRRFAAELKWLGSITGPTRDLDVYRLKMPAYRAKLPTAAARRLDALDDFLARRQAREQRRLAAALESERYRTLVTEWKAFLAEPARRSEAPNAARGVREVAGERIVKAWKRVMKHGRAVNDASSAGEVHRLRISCKKLRYLLEFFRSLFPAEEIKALIKALKQLQDTLGDFNDYEVQRHALEEYAVEMAETGDVPAPTLLAMGRLVDRLQSGQEEERRHFSERFTAFAAAENATLVRELFGADAPRRGEKKS